MHRTTTQDVTGENDQAAGPPYASSGSPAARGEIAAAVIAGPDPPLTTRIRLADGRLFSGALPARRHRAIHLGLLHSQSDGFVEIAAGRRAGDGRLRITTRRDPTHFLPGGASAGEGSIDVALALIARHAERGEEVFIAPAVRHERAASKTHVSHTDWLWIDVDGHDGLPAVSRLLSRRPAHLIIQSAGSGGVHCYWRLHSALRGDAIEHAHEHLIYGLGHELRDGRPVPTIADPACKDRSRVMRLARTVNGKSGRHARIIWADLALAPWSAHGLLGDLPDAPHPPRRRARAGAPVNHDDPYKRIAPVKYFHVLAGIEVPQHGLVSCPNPAHEDATPSCHVGRDAGEGWCCHGCGAAGAIYDLASVLLGGPTGHWLRGERFQRTQAAVREAFGDPRAPSAITNRCQPRAALRQDLAWVQAGRSGTTADGCEMPECS